MENSKKRPIVSVNLLISIGVWLVLILIHSFSIGGESNGKVPFFWEKTSLYYSTWFLDFLLIGTWYLNYCFFAPKLIAKRKFVAYGVVVVLFMVLGLFFQLMLFYLFKWPMPLYGSSASASLFGCMAMLALFAIGFSARSIKSWILLQDKVSMLEKEKQSREETIADLRRQLEEKDVAVATVPMDEVKTAPQEEDTQSTQGIERLAEGIGEHDEPLL